MKKKISKTTMWPVYQYGDHPKGTGTIGELAGAVMHGNPSTKVMRLNNALRTSPVAAPKPVAIVSGRVGGLSYIYSISEVVKWRRAHVEHQTTKREQIMHRATHRAELSKRRTTKAKEIDAQASGAKLRYKKYVKMRQQAEDINVSQIKPLDNK